MNPTEPNTLISELSLDIAGLKNLIEFYQGQVIRKEIAIAEILGTQEQRIEHPALGTLKKGRSSRPF